MEDKKEYAIERADHVHLGTLATRPEKVIEVATTIANQLKNIVETQRLYSVISQRKYVRVEGWNTLGAIMGVLPREQHVVKLDNGYEAYVELIRASDGAVIGGASAICTREERNWSNRDEYAVRSMAITRATGKAFRLGFSWIMQLAGFEPTPWEEMPIEGEFTEPAPQPNGNERPYSPLVLRDTLQRTAYTMKQAIEEQKQWAVELVADIEKYRGVVAGNIEKAFAGDAKSAEKRHSFLAFVWGDDVTSAKDLTEAQVLAHRKHLNWSQDSGGEWVIDELAAKEIRAAVQQRMEEQHAGSLFPEANDDSG
jgi:hypothetical protein